MKAELRRNMRAQRRALSPAEQKSAARHLAGHVAAARWFRVSRRVACYLPNDGEIDPSVVIERIWQMRKQAFLPVLGRGARHQLWFAELKPNMKMTTNVFGILEPKVIPHHLIRAPELDLVLIPLVAFDDHCNRLGMGKGFYDHTLEFLRNRHYYRKPHLIGLAHDFQRLPRLACDPWDVPLNGIVTDRAIYTAPL
ncbi:MAG: 5-formyltetrahydrofolate cyclo-ligase [Gammaproteobacteria bacterium]|nr:5-formyltetrahydrofolate cyclo-ligase [Gammaproteobacteria bacterium]